MILPDPHRPRHPAGPLHRCAHQRTPLLPAGRCDRSAEAGTAPPAPRPGVDYIDLTVAELGEHTAYLDPLTGTGFLVLEPLDWQAALDELDELGWYPLDNDDGRFEVAGRTTDGRVAVCLYSHRAVIHDPDITIIRKALAALRFAADLEPE